MIVEMRFYTTQVGRTQDFVRLYESKGLPIQAPIQGHLIGMFTTEFGPATQVVVLWGYADDVDRRRRRAKLMELPEWRAFLTEAAPLIQSEESRMLNPTPGSPVR